MSDDKSVKSGPKTLLLYWSATGNTERVAGTIEQTLTRLGVDLTVSRVQDAGGIELYDYDLVFLGAPSFRWLPPKPVLSYLDKRMEHHEKRGDVKLGAPHLPGKKSVVFCTYSGPHTGINEAIPTCKYMGQFFEHIGFEVAGEWCIVGEFHGSEERSTQGRLGDIRGRPNAADLKVVEGDVVRLIESIRG